MFHRAAHSTHRPILRQAGRLALALLMALALFATSATATGPRPPAVALHQIEGHHNLVPHLELLPDPGGRLTIEGIASAEAALRFQPQSGRYLHISALGRSVYWLRFSVSASPAEASRAERWMLEFGVPYLEDLRIYLSQPSGESAELVGWKELALEGGPSGREPSPPYRHTVFRLPAAVHAGGEIYLRLVTSLPINAPVHIYDQDQLISRTMYGYLGFGVFYGIMLAMIILNLSMFFSLRDRVYLYYVFYTTAMLFYNLFMFGQIKSILNPPPQLAAALPMCFIALIYFTAGLLNRTYLRTKRYAPVWDKAIRVFMAVSVVQLIACLSGLITIAGVLGFVLGAATPFLGVATWFRCLQKGFKPSFFFLAAWLMFLSGTIIWELIWLGLAPTYVWSDYGFAMGTSLEAMLLSFAMGQRVRSLREEKEALATSERRYQQLSITDGLTGLYNKRYFSSRLTSEADHARRLGQPMALAMLDVDRFKQFNDTHGHPAGDRVLAELARVIMSSTRPGDCCCRYGGEEFSIILPGADLKEARVVADRIRFGFMDAPFQEKFRKAGLVTVSVGLATLQDGESPAALLSRADKALYHSKDQGRNRTESAD